MTMYVVTVWLKDGRIYAETYISLKNAKAGYKRIVEPGNPHTPVKFAYLSKVMESYPNRPY
jgi:hypothetical protein